MKYAYEVTVFLLILFIIYFKACAVNVDERAEQCKARGFSALSYNFGGARTSSISLRISFGFGECYLIAGILSLRRFSNHINMKASHSSEAIFNLV